ncbi:MAG: xanthine dehydrogenase family protein subunit M [Gammaproteobacteria bacterium]|nr:xanthine dehydrogenase family protein subunit M [Gammaproteobacteria bacterium]
MRYESPTTVEAAVALLGAGNARVLAGGTDLIVQYRSGRIAPDVVVDIKHIDATRKISEENGGYRIGAAVSGAEINENAALCKAWPGVTEATDLIGSTQIQGRASLGGNLCNASPAADTVPALIAANAVCTVAGPNGTREVPVEKIPAGPGKTSLAAGEFVVSLTLPKRPAHSGDAYLRFIPRTEMDIAVVGAGVNLVLDASGTVTDARVAVGAVAPTALLVPDAGKALVGSKLEQDALDKMAAAVRAVCKPINDKRGTIEYRTKVAGVMAQRAAKIAYERARSN